MIILDKIFHIAFSLDNLGTVIELTKRAYIVRHAMRHILGEVCEWTVCLTLRRSEHTFTQQEYQFSSPTMTVTCGSALIYVSGKNRALQPHQSFNLVLYCACHCLSGMNSLGKIFLYLW